MSNRVTNSVSKHNKDINFLEYKSQINLLNLQPWKANITTPITILFPKPNKTKLSHKNASKQEHYALAGMFSSCSTLPLSPTKQPGCVSQCKGRDLLIAGWRHQCWKMAYPLRKIMKKKRLTKNKVELRGNARGSNVVMRIPQHYLAIRQGFCRARKTK